MEKDYLVSFLHEEYSVLNDLYFDGKKPEVKRTLNNEIIRCTSKREVYDIITKRNSVYTKNKIIAIILLDE